MYKDKTIDELVRKAREAAFNLDKLSFDELASEIQSQIDLQIILNGVDPLLHRLGYHKTSRPLKRIRELSKLFSDYYTDLGDGILGSGYSYKRLGRLFVAQEVKGFLGDSLLQYSKRIPRWVKGQIKPAVKTYFSRIPLTINSDLHYDSSIEYLKQATRLRPHVINAYLELIRTLLGIATENIHDNKDFEKIMYIVDELTNKTVRLMRLQLSEVRYLHPKHPAYPYPLYPRKDRFGYKISYGLLFPSFKSPIGYAPTKIINRFSRGDYPKETGYVVEHPDIRGLIIWIPHMAIEEAIDKPYKIRFNPELTEKYGIKPKIIAYPINWGERPLKEALNEAFLQIKPNPPIPEECVEKWPSDIEIDLPSSKSENGYVSKRVLDKYRIDNELGYVVEHPDIPCMLLWLPLDLVHDFENGIQKIKFGEESDEYMTWLYHHQYKTPPRIVAYPYRWGWEFEPKWEARSIFKRFE